MVFRQKAYDKLKALSLRWDISLEDICYSIEIGVLRACVWLPRRYVEIGSLTTGKFDLVGIEEIEGFVALRPQDFRILHNKESAELHTFLSVDDGKQAIRLPYEPRQFLLVSIHEVVVLRADHEAFERCYHLAVAQFQPKRPPTDIRFVHSSDYRHVQIGAHRFVLGELQAKIVRHLHRAMSTSQPWVHTGTLLEISGASADRVRDIFKSKKHWRKLIELDGEGYYRLNIPQEESERSS